MENLQASKVCSVLLFSKGRQNRGRLNDEEQETTFQRQRSFDSRHNFDVFFRNTSETNFKSKHFKVLKLSHISFQKVLAYMIYLVVSKSGDIIYWAGLKTLSV